MDHRRWSPTERRMDFAQSGFSDQPAPPRVVVIAQNALFRRGLSTTLEAAGIEVCLEAAGGEDRLAIIGQARPAVAVVDLDRAATARVAGIVQPVAALVPVVVLAPRLEHVTAALLAGAAAGVSRGARPELVAQAVREAWDGHGLVAGPSVAALVDLARAGTVHLEAENRIRTELSAREKQVLELVADGYDNAAIGVALCISARTVKNHLASIFHKLSLDNRVQAAVFAVRGGLTVDGPRWSTHRHPPRRDVPRPFEG
jgi:DNA-binding NarL/FixJ family response regulator